MSVRERGSNRAVGSTHAGHRVSGRRRLAAGESRRGGGLRKMPTGLGFGRGLRLQEAESLAHPTEATARARVD